MNTLILYTSRGGTTEQYAKWINEEFPETILQSIDESDISFDRYEQIIYVSPTYSGQIIGKDYLEENWERMKDKKVFLLIIGMIPMDTDWSRKSYESISEEIRKSLNGYVKIPGRNPNPGKETGRLERFMMKTFMKIEPEEIEEQAGVQKNNLEPVFGWLKN